MTSATFTPGLSLCAAFYREIVRPLLDQHFPRLRYSAGLIGSGSEVLGFDDEISTDHHWGPRLMLFVDENDVAELAPAIRQTLAHHLPYTFGGYSTHFSAPDADDNGVQHLETIESGPVNHRISVQSLHGFGVDYLGVDNLGVKAVDTFSAADWLSLPSQKLRALTGGALYHDGLGVEALRQRLSWYPHDLWLYLLASGWARIGQEEHLAGRCGMVGDELGAAIIASRLVRDIMRLSFLMERVYAPYPKWFGTAFAQLDCAQAMMPQLLNVQSVTTWKERERNLALLYAMIARTHNALGVTAPLPTEPRDFFGRPVQAIALHGFTDALLAEIRDPAVAGIARQRPIGNIDQFSDSTDLREDVTRRAAICALYNEN